MNRLAVFACVGLLCAALAACSGGSASSTPVAPASTATTVTTTPVPTATATPTPAPTATPTPVPAATATPVVTTSTQQVITMALPSTLGTVTDPTYGLIGGYTQQQSSQVLGFVPGAQVMISNGQAGVPHTLNVLSTSAFPASPTISTAASGGSTLAAGYGSGSVTNGTMVGPITLSAGTYFIGCAFHYASNTMRTALIVAPNATPGVQANAAPAATAVPNPYGY